MFSVETHSFLPNQQSDRSDLPRQSETRHRRLQPFGNERSVEILERPCDPSGSYGRTLKYIFQIVIMVLVESADGEEFLGTLDLAFHKAVLPTDAGLQRQAAISSELPLGAKPVRCL
jgi:hypothetical protein